MKNKKEIIEILQNADKTFDIAIDAIKKLSEIEKIISCPLPIQEDIFRYKAICEVVKR